MFFWAAEPDLLISLNDRVDRFEKQVWVVNLGLPNQKLPQPQLHLILLYSDFYLSLPMINQHLGLFPLRDQTQWLFPQAIICFLTRLVRSILTFTGFNNPEVVEHNRQEGSPFCFGQLTETSTKWVVLDGTLVAILKAFDTLSILDKIMKTREKLVNFGSEI